MRKESVPADDVAGAERVAARARKWIGRDPVRAATLGGLLLYGSFRLDFFMFYGRFGVSPEEVGHGYASTLAQSLVGGAFVFVAIFVVLYLLVVAAVMTAGPAISMFRRNWRTALIALPSALVCGFGLAWLLDMWTPLDLGGPKRLLGSAVLSVLVSLVFDEVATSWTPRRTLTEVRKLVAASSVVAALAVFLVILPMFARQDAIAVRAGYNRPFQFAGSLSLPWSADIAHVHWLGDAVVPGLQPEECFMYLGRSDGVAVLWHPEEGEIYRVPDSEIVLVSPDDRSCSGRT